MGQDSVKRRTLRDIVNTPFKKAMFVVQLISYVFIVGSPFIGGIIGKALHLTVKGVTVSVLVIFVTGEILFYSSLFFLGKELILIIKEKVFDWFKRKNQ